MRHLTLVEALTVTEAVTEIDATPPVRVSHLELFESAQPQQAGLGCPDRELIIGDDRSVDVHRYTLLRSIVIRGISFPLSDCTYLPGEKLEKITSSQATKGRRPVPLAR